MDDFLFACGMRKAAEAEAELSFALAHKSQDSRQRLRKGGELAVVIETFSPGFNEPILSFPFLERYRGNEKRFFTFMSKKLNEVGAHFAELGL